MSKSTKTKQRNYELFFLKIKSFKIFEQRDLKSFNDGSWFVGFGVRGPEFHVLRDLYGGLSSLNGLLGDF